MTAGRQVTTPDATMQHASESEDEYHSLSGHEAEDDDGDVESETMDPPVHPVSSMQEAFEESIIESTEDDDGSKSSLNADAEARRRKLLESSQYDDSWTTRWRQKPTAQHHPLLKFMAQIVFGMHLLQQQQAKSEEEVVKILQNHVNEVDSFLERTSEDFDLAIKDIEERIRYLKLPMKHLDVFDIMLDDKKFRTQLLDGNDKIEKIIDRTAKAMNASLLDVQKGVEANKELGMYLDNIHDQWPRGKRAISDVFDAMRGNEQGWAKYLKDLRAKGKNVGMNLASLGTVINEMSKLAAVASRRNKAQSRAIPSGSKSAPSSPGLRSKFSRDPPPDMPLRPSRTSNLNKPLPQEPPGTRGAPQPNAKLHPVPFAERYEKPRQSPRSPNGNIPRAATISNGTPPRPRTAGHTPKEARAANARESSAGLAEFFKNSGPPRSNPNPLRSNPPDASPDTAGADKKLVRSHSQGANVVLSAAPNPMTRSKSQGAIDVLSATKRQDMNTVSSVTTSKKEADKSVRSSSDKNDRQDSVHSTGFARRLSKRLKHIPPPKTLSTTTTTTNNTNNNNPKDAEKSAPPPDSAYSSGTDRKPSPYEAHSTEEEKQRPRTSSGLGLFPKTSQPLSPAIARARSPYEDAIAIESDNGSGTLAPASVKSLASAPVARHRTLSIRKMFHQRWNSRRVAS